MQAKMALIFFLLLAFLSLAILAQGLPTNYKISSLNKNQIDHF